MSVLYGASLRHRNRRAAERAATHATPAVVERHEISPTLMHHLVGSAFLFGRRSDRWERSRAVDAVRAGATWVLFIQEQEARAAAQQAERDAWRAEMDTWLPTVAS